MERSTNYVTLKALLRWDDACTDTQERLVTLAGSVGLVVEGGVIEFFSIDHWSGETIRTRITGPWSFGTIRLMAAHLVMVENMRECG